MYFAIVKMCVMVMKQTFLFPDTRLTAGKRSDKTGNNFLIHIIFQIQYTDFMSKLHTFSSEGTCLRKQKVIHKLNIIKSTQNE